MPVLFAPDIDAITHSPMINTIKLSSHLDKIASCGDGDGDNELHHFLYLREWRDVHAARNTVRLYSRALGTRRCARVIDSYFAEIFESCS